MNYKLIKKELEKPAPFQTTRTLTKVINAYNGLISNPFSNKKSKDVILYYWDLINHNQPQRFQKEVQVALLGNNSFSSWQEMAIKQFQDNCNYLISNRGFDEWKI